MLEEGNKKLHPPSSQCTLGTTGRQAEAHLEKLSALLSKKVTMAVQYSSPPKRQGNGLHVLLEKISRKFLIERMRSILLMEANYNHEALNTLAAEGYIPKEFYAQKEITVEDAGMENYFNSNSEC